MRIDYIIQAEDKREEFGTISLQCYEFINESCGFPLLKNLPTTYANFQKVKVRKRKPRDHKGFSEMFNSAFESSVRDLRERSIFANGERLTRESTNVNQEAFYIFPIDGFEFMYSTEVNNSSVNYKKTFDSILEQLGADKGRDIISELLQFNYTTDNLKEGLEAGSEIIIYNIPYFYAIRKGSVDNYSKLIHTIQEIE